MSMFRWESSCATKAERRWGRLLSAVSSMVLMFQHASLIPVAPVSRKGLWQIMEHLGCPPKFLSMVMQLHEDQCGQVRNSNDLSEPFLILNRVKQGCVLAPTLFTIFFNGPQQILATKMASTYDTVLMEACSTYGACRPIPRPRSN